jgi:hypothetical protein
MEELEQRPKGAQHAEKTVMDYLLGRWQQTACCGLRYQAFLVA